MSQIAFKALTITELNKQNNTIIGILTYYCVALNLQLERRG